MSDLTAKEQKAVRTIGGGQVRSHVVAVSGSTGAS
jgi:hypothetical protein